MHKFLNIGILSLLLCSGGSFAAEASTRHALLIGINQYLPKPEYIKKHNTKIKTIIKNLNGPVYDIEAMKRLLLNKYNFTDNNITLLQNSEATRDNILQKIEEITAKAKLGDQVVFYYSGHGSQVKNSASIHTEYDGGWEETIVPADAYAGVPQIRDKELKYYFKQLLCKGADKECKFKDGADKIQLTVILDSCHSGSATRGVPGDGQARLAPKNTKDINERKYVHEQYPKDNKPIVLSAAQDDEVAKEIYFDSTLLGMQFKENEKPIYGGFTYALISTLRSAPLNMPLNEVFLSVKSQLSTQTPNLEEPREWQNRPFLSKKVGENSETMVAVKIQPDGRKLDKNGEVEVEGGIAIGLQKGCRLRKPNTNLELEVTQVDLATSRAKVISGDIKSLVPGDFLEVSQWMREPLSYLNVWLPAPLKTEGIQRIVDALPSLKTQYIELVMDPTIKSPTHTLLHTQEGWLLLDHKQNQIKLGHDLDLSRLSLPANSKLFLSIPPDEKMHDEIMDAFKDAKSAVKITPDLHKGSYYFLGRSAEELEYALVAPGVREVQYHNSMPVKSEWFIQKNLPGLIQSARNYSKIQGWLNLNLNSGSEAKHFPYHLALQDYETGQFLDPLKDSKVVGKKYKLVIKENESAKESDKKKRFAYVLAISPNGETEIFFPDIEYGSNDNKFPQATPLTIGAFKRNTPPGMDTYILFATSTALSNTHLAAMKMRVSKEFSEERSKRGSGFPDFILDLASGERNERSERILNWSLQRISFKTVCDESGKLIYSKDCHNN